MKKMKSNIEIVMYKNGEKYVFYKFEKLYAGIVRDIVEAYALDGCRVASVRII